MFRGLLNETTQVKRFGLIGFPLSHSFSKGFFEDKFKRLGLKDHHYDVFEMEHISNFPALWEKYPELVGVNVTIPHKEKVLQYLDSLDDSAKKVGAANVIHKRGGQLVGFNSDYMAFRESLTKWMGDFSGEALILGTGGASKAVQACLRDLLIPFKQVSRSSTTGDYTYEQLTQNENLFTTYKLIVNTTPVGMYPNGDKFPDLPYHVLDDQCFLYDLVYNPEETLFMQKGMAQGAKAKNGLQMLHLQAEKSWEIWNH